MHAMQVTPASELLNPALHAPGDEPPHPEPLALQAVHAVLPAAVLYVPPPQAWQLMPPSLL